MKKTITVSLIGAVFASPIYAVETIHLESVVVTASRTPQTRESVIGDVSIIDAEEIPVSYTHLGVYKRQT